MTSSTTTPQGAPSALDRDSATTGWPTDYESMRNAAQLQVATAEEMSKALASLRRVGIEWLTMPRDECWSDSGRMCALKRFVWELGPRLGGIGIYDYFNARCRLTPAQVDYLTHLYDSARTRAQGRALVVRELRAHIQSVAVLQQGVSE